MILSNLRTSYYYPPIGSFQSRGARHQYTTSGVRPPTHCATVVLLSPHFKRNLPLYTYSLCLPGPTLPVRKVSKGRFFEQTDLLPRWIREKSLRFNIFIATLCLSSPIISAYTFIDPSLIAEGGSGNKWGISPIVLRD